MLYERVFRQPLSISHLQVFGSKCFIKVPNKTRSKLDDKAKEFQLIGFKGDSIYIVVDVNKKKLQSHNVIFMEGTENRYNKNGPPWSFLQWSTHLMQNLMRPERKGVGQKCGVLTLHANLNISQIKKSVTRFSSQESMLTHPISKHPKPTLMPSASPKASFGKMPWIMNLTSWKR